MTDQQFPDPFNEALARTGERGVQLLSLVAAGAQHWTRWQAATRERQARRRAQRLHELEVERQRARLTWAPAHDATWLAQADVLETARVWSAALPYTDRETKWFDPSAESAMRNCEDRLRVLHPHAMARYDRLRADGWSPEPAMREAAPLFDRPPNVHESGPGRWPIGELTAAEPGTIPERGATFARVPHGPSKAEYLAFRRAKRIADRLRSTARAHGRAPLGRGELRTVLETLTNLPPDTVDRLVAPAPETARAGDAGLGRDMAQRAATAERARSADLNTATDEPATRFADERTDQLRDAARQAAVSAAYRAACSDGAVDVAARDFPFTAQQVVDAAQRGPLATPGRVTTTARMHRVHAGRR